MSNYRSQIEHTHKRKTQEHQALNYNPSGASETDWSQDCQSTRWDSGVIVMTDEIGSVMMIPEGVIEGHPGATILRRVGVPPQIVVHKSRVLVERVVTTPTIVELHPNERMSATLTNNLGGHT